MRLIDADAIVTKNPEVIEALKNAPTVEKAVVLPFMPGDALWYVDEEDCFKVKCYTEDDANDYIHGVAVFKESFEIIGPNGDRFDPGETYSCTSKEEAEALQKKLISKMSCKQMIESIKRNAAAYPEVWEAYLKEFQEGFQELIKKCP